MPVQDLCKSRFATVWLEVLRRLQSGGTVKSSDVVGLPQWPRDVSRADRSSMTCNFLSKLARRGLVDKGSARDSWGAVYVYSATERLSAYYKEELEKSQVSKSNAKRCAKRERNEALRTEICEAIGGTHHGVATRDDIVVLLSHSGLRSQQITAILSNMVMEGKLVGDVRVGYQLPGSAGTASVRERLVRLRREIDDILSTLG